MNPVSGGASVLLLLLMRLELLAVVDGITRPGRTCGVTVVPTTHPRCLTILVLNATVCASEQRRRKMMGPFMIVSDTTGFGRGGAGTGLIDRG